MFRGGTIVVPLTVTVVDAKGAPVKDLKASDFTVTENKSVREITNFFPQEFAAGPVPAGEVTPARVKEAGVKPQTRRMFLIVLGYGRIEHPTKALEGAIDLVNRLLPQDAVAVMAFHRTTVFTTDHQRIAQLLERYRKRAREDRRRDQQLPLHGARAGRSVTWCRRRERPLRQRADSRQDPEAHRRDLPRAGTGRGSGGCVAFLRNTADLLIGMDRVVPVVEKPGQHQETFGSITKTLRDSGESMTDEVLLSTKLKFYAGVEYLRRFEGEKQMVFFSGIEGGGTLGDSAYRPDGRGGTVCMPATPTAGSERPSRPPMQPIA